MEITEFIYAEWNLNSSKIELSLGERQQMILIVDLTEPSIRIFGFEMQKCRGAYSSMPMNQFVPKKADWWKFGLLLVF